MRAGIVEDLKVYKWSSYLDYLERRRSIERMDTEFILKQFDEDMGSARRKYRGFVLKNAVMDTPLKELYRGIALGSEKYIERIEEKISSMGR